MASRLTIPSKAQMDAPDAVRYVHQAQRRCREKWRYSTKKGAKSVADKMNKGNVEKGKVASWDKALVYKCAVCRNYHVGRRRR